MKTTFATQQSQSPVKSRLGGVLSIGLMSIWHRCDGSLGNVGRRIS